MIKINKIAPDFKVSSTNNREYSLKQSKGNYVVLFFYPKDDTPGCTIETKDFNILLPKFKKLNCEIFGISKDDMESHKKFKKKYKVKFDLLSDENKKILKSYKVWGKKKFMGMEFMGIKRTTFLIGKNRKIIKIWNNVKVKNHAEEVLNTLKKLRK